MPQPQITILGAGMAGLIAGHMLRRFSPLIREAKSSPPDNHSALLRFRSDAVSNATSIPFNKVMVRKGIYDDRSKSVISKAEIPHINAYAQRVSGIVHDRSISNLDPGSRWIAPDNFLSQLYDSCPANIKLDAAVSSLELGAKSKDEVWVSTLPMPMMMEMVGWTPESDFSHKPITTIQARITKPLATVFQTVYFPTSGGVPEFSCLYRASITGDLLILELTASPGDMESTLRNVCEVVLRECFGISSPLVTSPEVKRQKFGKILPVNEQERKRFILHLTEQYNIYSLGRFATWRPILLDDVVSDIRVIEKLMQSSAFDRAKH